MRPSGKFEGLNNRTADHDAIQLWMSDEDNLREATIEFTSEFEIHRNAKITIEIEKPIQGYNNYLVGIVDGIIDINDRCHCFEIGPNGYSNGEFLPNAIYRRIIYEIKPQLYSISQTIGQLKSCAEWLKYYGWYGGCKDSEMRKPSLLLLTLDPSGKFDKMLNAQGIRSCICSDHIMEPYIDFDLAPRDNTSRIFGGLKLIIKLQ